MPQDTPANPTVLFVSNEPSQCGVYQFGLHVAAALRTSQRYKFVYVECGNAAAYAAALNQHTPAVAIVNYHPTTMPWLNWRVAGRWHGPTVGMVHEVTQELADAATDDLFPFHVAADPTLMLRNPIVFKTGRVIPNYRNEHSMPAIPTIGSFGFGTTGKGFERLITEVQSSFDRAVIRLSIPASSFYDANGSRGRAIAERCRDLVVKPGIQLEVSHDFLEDQQLLDFLAQNSLNAFLYDYQNGRGLSSAVDYALAVERPIAVTRSSMFRHILGTASPITIEDSPLSDILARGFSPLRRYYDEWQPDNLVWDYERIVARVLDIAAASAQNERFRDLRRVVRAAGRRAFSLAEGVDSRIIRTAAGRKVATALKNQQLLRKTLSFLKRRIVGGAFRPARNAGSDWVPTTVGGMAEDRGHVVIPKYDPSLVSVAGFNRILDRSATRAYQPTIDYLFRHMPEVMSRKIPEANVQQAFVLDTVVRLLAGNDGAPILCVGSYEDTAAGCLIRAGYAVEEVDPLLNYDLATYLTKPTCKHGSFAVVFATSVIEHVADDGQFLRDIEDLLAIGGVCVLTCDFNDSYHPGDQIPRADQRFYTQRDIRERLMPLVSRCELVDTPQWDCPEPDFFYDGCRYTFASLVFRRTR